MLKSVKFGDVMENHQENEDSKSNVDGLNDDKNSTTEVDKENITDNEVTAKKTKSH